MINPFGTPHAFRGVTLDQRIQEDSNESDMGSSPPNTAGEIRVGDASDVLPEFGRVNDVKRIFGVKRGILYRWIKDRKVKSVCIRERGNKQGVRLIHLQSVREHIYRQMSEGSN